MEYFQLSRKAQKRQRNKEMTQQHVTFKDKTKLATLKPNTQMVYLGISRKGNLVVEFHVVTGNWHCGMITDLEIEDMKKNRPEKWEEVKSQYTNPNQKRKEYTQEEFDEYFELVH